MQHTSPLSLWLLAAALLTAAPASAAPGQTVIPAGSAASLPAGTEHFTGSVRVDPAFSTEAPQRVYGAYVTFEPGARTDWHTHPLGQTLVVTFGTGLTQEWGGPIRTIHQGDVVICRPNVKHWHGAAKDSWFSHLAVEVPGDETSNEWLEAVDNTVYFES